MPTNLNNIEASDKEEIEKALIYISKSHKLWLWSIVIFASLTGILNGMYIISYVFFTGDDTHYCSIPELKNAVGRWTPEQIENISMANTGDYHSDECHRLNLDYFELSKLGFENASLRLKTLNNSKLIQCEEFVYAQTGTVIWEVPTFGVNIMSTFYICDALCDNNQMWNLVCDKFYQRSHVQSFYAVGKFFGSFFFGIMADKVGRRQGFTLAALCYMLSGVLVPFLDSFYVFLLQRFIIGASSCGCYVTAYTLVSEIVIGKSRTWMVSLYNVPYPIGMIILTMLAYYIPSWQSLQLIISLLTLFLAVHCCMLPESPLWLLSQGNRTEAWKILKSICPGITIPNSVTHAAKTDNVKIPSTECKKTEPFFQMFFSMFSTAELTRRTIASYFIWFMSSLLYYGLTLTGGNFDVNRYFYVSSISVLEILCYIIPVPLFSRYGRKSCYIVSLTSAGLALFSIIIIPRSFRILIALTASIGRFCSTAAFVIYELYTSELFPTSHRNTAIGTSLTFSHIGTIIAPYVVDGLGHYIWYLPSTIFGILALLGVLAVLPLPETKDKPLYNSIEEMNYAIQNKLPPLA